MNIEELVRPVGADAPCGPDLEYDRDFLDLDEAARGRPERQVGDSVLAAEEPDWKSVAEQAERLLRQSKDLRAAVHLAQALTALRGLDGLADALALIECLLNTFWDGVHPCIDADGDPTMRMNALAPLADATGLLRTLRGAQLVSARGLAAATVRDAEIALGMLDSLGRTPVYGLGQIEAMLQAAAADHGAPANPARRALAHVEAIAAILTARVGPHDATDLRSLVGRLQPLADLWDRAVGNRSDRHGAAPAAGASQHPVASAAAAGLADRADVPSSRDDARRLLERVCEFLERTEPSNPAPLLIRRAMRLMSMDFLDIMRELAPEALGAVETIAGRMPDPSEIES